MRETRYGRQAGLSKLLLIIIILLLLLLAGGAAAGLYLTGMIGGDEDGAATAEPVRQPALYREIDPPITVNLTRDGIPQAVLQVRLQVMTREEKTLEDLGRHMPMIRNNLIMLFADQQPEELTSREGKDALREASRDEINKILEDERGHGEVEAVFFTHFVIQ